MSETESRTGAEAAAHSASKDGGAPWAGPMSMCPMARTCKGMVERPSSGLFMFLPGLVFIGVGVLIIFVPQALVWLIAAAFILFGSVMLGMAGFMRAVAAQLRAAGG